MFRYSKCVHKPWECAVQQRMMEIVQSIRELSAESGSTAVTVKVCEIQFVTYRLNYWLSQHLELFFAEEIMVMLAYPNSHVLILLSLDRCITNGNI